MPFEPGASDAFVPAVARNVSVDFPEPVIEAGEKVHVGAGDTIGEMLLQDRFTVPVKPFSPVTAMLEIDDPPGATKEGENGEAVMVKSAGAL